MEPASEFKFHHQTFVRSTSLPYCGSETESELYAPYGFYTGDEVRSRSISRTGRDRVGGRVRYRKLYNQRTYVLVLKLWRLAWNAIEMNKFDATRDSVSNNLIEILVS